MRKTIKLKENELGRIISESVKRVLRENTYVDSDGEEWDETDIEGEISFIFQNFSNMDKQEVTETLQWIKNMGADGISLIRKVVNDEIKNIEQLEQKLVKLYNFVN